MHLNTPQKRWPPLENKRWARIAASICFVIGALCILVYFITLPPQGWGPSIFLLYGPLLLGITGIIFGIIAQRWYLIVLNALPPLTFPAIMFFGTLIEAVLS